MNEDMPNSRKKIDMPTSIFRLCNFAGQFQGITINNAKKSKYVLQKGRKRLFILDNSTLL